MRLARVHRSTQKKCSRSKIQSNTHKTSISGNTTLKLICLIENTTYSYVASKISQKPLAQYRKITVNELGLLSVSKIFKSSRTNFSLAWFIAYSYPFRNSAYIDFLQDRPISHLFSTSEANWKNPLIFRLKSSSFFSILWSKNGLYEQSWLILEMTDSEWYLSWSIA